MEHINCPTCGAKTDSVISNCEYCGVEFKRAQALTPQEHVAAVGKAVFTAKERADWVHRDDAESAAVMSIPIPSDIPTLTAFFMFCHSNVKTGLEGTTEPQKAWKAKAKGAYDMLRLASINNPQLSKFLEEFKSSYSAEAMKAADAAIWKWLGIVGIVFVLVIVLAILFA